MIYNVSTTLTHEKTMYSGTIPVEAHSRREAIETVKGRLGPGTVAVVTGVRS